MKVCFGWAFSGELCIGNFLEQQNPKQVWLVVFFFPNHSSFHCVCGNRWPTTASCPLWQYSLTRKKIFFRLWECSHINSLLDLCFTFPCHFWGNVLSVVFCSAKLTHFYFFFSKWNIKSFQLISHPDNDRSAQRHPIWTGLANTAPLVGVFTPLWRKKNK